MQEHPAQKQIAIQQRVLISDRAGQPEHADGMRGQPAHEVMMIACGGRIFKKLMRVSFIHCLNDQYHRIIADRREGLLDLLFHLLGRDRPFLYKIIDADVFIHDHHLLDAKLQLMIMTEHISGYISDHPRHIPIELFFGYVPVFRIHRPAFILQRKRKVRRAFCCHASATAAEQHADGSAVSIRKLSE